MKKVFSLFAIIALSAIAVSAQTVRKNEFSNSRRGKVESKRILASNKTAAKNDPRVLRVGPSTTYLRNGLSINDVMRVLGKPDSVSENGSGETRLATYTFPRSEGRILIAEFENGVLVSSRMETSELVVQNK